MRVQCCRHRGVDGVSAHARRLVVERMLVGRGPHEHDALRGIDACELDARGVLPREKHGHGGEGQLQRGHGARHGAAA